MMELRIPVLGVMKVLAPCHLQNQCVQQWLNAAIFLGVFLVVGQWCTTGAWRNNPLIRVRTQHPRDHLIGGK